MESIAVHSILYYCIVQGWFASDALALYGSIKMIAQLVTYRKMYLRFDGAMCRSFQKSIRQSL